MEEITSVLTGYFYTKKKNNSPIVSVSALLLFFEPLKYNILLRKTNMCLTIRTLGYNLCFFAFLIIYLSLTAVCVLLNNLRSVVDSRFQLHGERESLYPVTDIWKDI